MEISRMLLKSQFDKLEEGYHALASMVQTPREEETKEIKIYVEGRLNQLHKVQQSLQTVNEKLEDMESRIFQISYRDLKLGLRMAGRKWRRFLTFETRNQRRTMARREHVATFAA